MPSAPRRKRTARADLPSRCAILPTGSYPAQFNKRSSSSAVQGRERGREACRGCSESCSTFSGEHDGSPAIAVLLRSCRMRRQQSPRFHSGTNCKTLLIASCFPAGPSFNPVLRTRSITGRNRGLIFSWVFLPAGLAGMATTSLRAGVDRPSAARVHAIVVMRQVPSAQEKRLVLHKERG